MKKKVKNKPIANQEINEPILNKQSRNSNIEFLRIVLMLLIIMHHYAMNNTKDLMGITSYNLTIWGGKIAVVTFVIISGYFLINSQFKIEKLLKLYFQVFFYSMLYLIIESIIDKSSLNLITILNYFFPISNKIYWFMSAYILLYILSPIIAKMLKGLTKEQYKKFLILVTILYIIPTNLLLQNRIENIELTFGFIYFFAIGGYIKLYGISYLENKKRKNIIILIITLSIAFIITEINDKIVANYDNQYLYQFIDKITMVRNTNSFIVVFCAILIFYIFKDIKIKNNKIINYIASKSLAAYLLHSNVNANIFKDEIFQKLFATNCIIESNSVGSLMASNTNLLNKITAIPTVALAQITNINAQLFLVIHAVIFSILLYAVAIVIDTLRVYILEKNIEKLLKKNIKIQTKLQAVNKFMNE